MPEDMIRKIADDANMIVAGYSYTKSQDGRIRVLNLADTDEACVLDEEGNMIETTVDDQTLTKIQAYYLKNMEFMEVENA